MFRYFVVFVIGIFSTFIIQSDLFDHSSIVLNVFNRICWGLFFTFLFWLLQPNRKKVEENSKKN
jgi:hypothetical protein